MRAAGWLIHKLDDGTIDYALLTRRLIAYISPTSCMPAAAAIQRARQSRRKRIHNGDSG